MTRRIRPLNLILLLSMPLLIAGLFLTVNACYKLHAAEAAAEQMEFLKNLPYVINSGERLKLPVFSENTILSQNPVLNGYAECGYYENTVSVRRIKIRVNYLFDSTEFTCLIDARSRN
jgi:hypothetical protein